MIHSDHIGPLDESSKHFLEVTDRVRMAEVKTSSGTLMRPVPVGRVISISNCALAKNVYFIAF